MNVPECDSLNQKPANVNKNDHWKPQAHSNESVFYVSTKIIILLFQKGEKCFQFQGKKIQRKE